jgi:SAM-dependent methyltransferase
VDDLRPAAVTQVEWDQTANVAKPLALVESDPGRMHIVNESANPAWAYGVDPTRPERYSLRQARYHALGETVADCVADVSRRGEILKLLDVGCWNGVSMRHIEPHDELGTVEYHGVDLQISPKLYRPERWRALHAANLLEGLPFLRANEFDVVICEQVLEHLPTIDVALQALHRVTKPGGLMILGVPIFPPGVDWVRRHAVPLWDRWFPPAKPRGHLQAFSRHSFVRAIESLETVSIVECRGFRMVSGGWLRSLENYRWWWDLQRSMGLVAPGLCTEVQVLVRKTAASAWSEPGSPGSPSSTSVPLQSGPLESVPSSIERSAAEPSAAEFPAPAMASVQSAGNTATSLTR